MEWFGGTLVQTSPCGTAEIKRWHGISFEEACSIANEIKEELPEMKFMFHPYPTEV